jgi:hypothetical protein
MADSVIIDLAKVLKGGRERLKETEHLRERLSELSTSTSEEAAALRFDIENHLAGRASGNVSDLSKRAAALAEAELRALAAAARRRSVLDGLANLGYQVTEGMETAWAERGNVVLRKMSDPTHGVELAGGQSDLLQVRAVAVGNPSLARAPADDREVETIWCDDFDRLKAFVTKSGGNLAIEQARPVGQYPLKIIAVDSAAAVDETIHRGRSA